MQLKNIAVLSISAAVAVVGIGIGAGGSAYADSLIGSSGIQDGSVRSKDVKDGTLRLADMRPGALAKLHGQDGKDASPSAAGAGYAGFPEANPHHDFWPAKSYGETVQKCGAGEYVTGGGFSQQGGSDDLGGTTRDVEILVSAPYTGEYVPISDADSRFHADRWIVRGYNGTDHPVDVRAWVLCAPLN